MVEKWIGLSVVVVAMGCGARPIEVGTGGGGSITPLPPPSGGPENFPLPSWPAPDECASQSNSALKGTWNGYFGRFQNPAADFRVDVRGASSTGGVCGTVTFEPAKQAPPPPTDPNVMYPADANRDRYLYLQFVPARLGGFAFTILEGRVQGSRAQMALALSQPWELWCQPQPSYELNPHPTDAHGYGCLPGWGGGPIDPFGSSCSMTNPDTDENVAIDCGRFYLCHEARVCACNGARCVGNQRSDITFELDFGADEASGKMMAQVNGGEVFLVRAK